MSKIVLSNHPSFLYSLWIRASELFAYKYTPFFFMKIHMAPNYYLILVFSAHILNEMFIKNICFELSQNLAFWLQIYHTSLICVYVFVHVYAGAWCVDEKRQSHVSWGIKTISCLQECCLSSWDRISYSLELAKYAGLVESDVQWFLYSASLALG